MLKRFAWSLLIICAALGTCLPVSAASAAASHVRAVAPVGTAPAVAGEFLVKFRPGTPGDVRQAIVGAHGGRIFDRIVDLDVEAVTFPALANAPANAVAVIVAALAHNPNVEFVEPNYIYSSVWTPNDPHVGSQYAWDRIDAFDAWNIGRGKLSIVIAIVDSGVQLNHPDLNDKIVAGYDYVRNDTVPSDGNGHGTHVAGTAAAETNNSRGGAGTCPNCRVMPVRVLDRDGNGTLLNVAKGINFASKNGAEVINLSLAGSGSATLKDAVDRAWNRGSFLACAAGNDSTSSVTYAYPAAYANCFAVASTDNADMLSSFSNYGAWVEAAAPGSSILSTWIGSSYRTLDGTSMATPHVAGLAGILAARGLTNAQIRNRMCKTADQISGTGSLWRCGRINAYRALKNDQNASTSLEPLILNSGFEEGTTAGMSMMTTARRGS